MIDTCQRKHQIQSNNLFISVKFYYKNFCCNSYFVVINFFTAAVSLL